jgi:hypothetical protein
MSEVDLQNTAPPIIASLFDNDDASMSTVESPDETRPPPVLALLYMMMQFDMVKCENDATPTPPPATNASFEVKRQDER